MHDRSQPDTAVLDEFAVLIEETTGLATPESNRSHLKRIVTRLAGAREVAPAGLLALTRRDPSVRQELVDAAMIGETYLFRESVHFRHVRDVVVPERARPGGALTAWSVSASTGEEAISLAVVVSHALQTVPGATVRIYAGDVRSDLIDRLATGRYPWSALRRDGEEFHETFRAKWVAAEDERTFTVSPTILGLIQPLHLNAFRDSLAEIPDDLDIIFFRNTLIYAGRPNRDRFVDRIVTKLAPGGYLFLANSELPFVRHPQLELVEDAGVYCFRRRVSASAEEPGSRDAGAAGPELEPVSASKRVVETGDVAAIAAVAAAAPAPAPGEPSAPSEAHALLLAISALLELPDLSALSGDSEEVAATPADEDDLVRSVAETIVRFYADLEEQRVARASLTLGELRSNLPDHAVTKFCSGWLAYTTGVVETALEEFAATLERDPLVWPARFYRGLLLSRTDPAAAHREFRRCLEETGDGAPEFRFFMGGFTRTHIRTVARRWMETHHGS